MPLYSPCLERGLREGGGENDAAPKSSSPTPPSFLPSSASHPPRCLPPLSMPPSLSSILPPNPSPHQVLPSLPPAPTSLAFVGGPLPASSPLHLLLASLSSTARALVLVPNLQSWTSYLLSDGAGRDGGAWLREQAGRGSERAKLARVDVRSVAHKRLFTGASAAMADQCVRCCLTGYVPPPRTWAACSRTSSSAKEEEEGV